MIIDHLFTQPIFEAADPSRLIVSVRIEPMSTGGEPIDKEVDLTGQFQGSMGSQMNQALDYMKKMLESKGFYFTTLRVNYQGKSLGMKNAGSMEPQSDEEREMDSMANQMRAKQSKQTALPAVKEEAAMASPEQLAYNRLRAQYDSYQTMTGGGGNTAVSRDPAHAAKLAKVPAELARMAAALKAKGIDAEAEYDALSGPAAAPVDANQAYGSVSEVAPPGDKAERMVKHIKAGYARDGKLTPKEKGIAFATAWKAHNAGRVEEATGDERFDSMMGQIQREPRIPDSQMPPTDVKDLYHWAVKHHKPYHKIFAKWANREGFKSVAPALQKAGNLDSDALDYWTPDVWKLWYGPDSEMPRHWSKERVPDELRDYLETVFDAYDRIVFDWPTEYRQISEQGMAEDEFDSFKFGKPITFSAYHSSKSEIKRILPTDEFYFSDDRHTWEDNYLYKIKITLKNPYVMLDQKAEFESHARVSLPKIKAAGYDGVIYTPYSVDYGFRQGVCFYPQRQISSIKLVNQNITGKQGVAKGRQIDEVFADQGSGSTDRDNEDYMKRRRAAKKAGYTGRETKAGTWRVFKDGNAVAAAGPFKSADEAAAWIKKHKQGITEMDKSQTPPGRDGDPRPGPEKIAKPISKEKMVNHALDTLSKSMAKKDDKKKDVKEGQEGQGVRAQLRSDFYALNDIELRRKYGLTKDNIRQLLKISEFPTSPVELANTVPGVKMAKMAGQSAVAAVKNKLDDLRVKNPNDWNKAMRAGASRMHGGPPQFPADAGLLMGDRAEWMKKVKSEPSEWDDTTGSIGMDPQMKSPFPPLMKKLQAAMVQEGRVKELADDLKTMSDAEFMKKYGKAKAAIRRDIKRVDEAEGQTVYTKQEIIDVLTGKKTQQQVDAERSQKPLKEVDAPAMPAAPVAPAAPTLPDPAAWRKAPGPGYQTNAIRDRSRVNGVWRNNPQAANPMSQDPAQRIAGYQEMEKRIAADNAAAKAGVDNSDPEAYEFDHWLDNGMGSATPVLKSGAVQGLFKKPLNQVPPGAKILPQYDTYQQQGEYAYPVVMGGVDQAFKVRIDQVPKGAKIVQAPQQGGALFKNLPGAAPATPPAAAAKPATPTAQPAPAPINELSTHKLAQYKTAAAKDAQAADKAGDFKRGDKRFHGIVQATKKQFDNDAKKVDESRAARRALMARIVNHR